jgi:putative aldouronate transport system permease protein
MNKYKADMMLKVNAGGKIKAPSVFRQYIKQRYLQIMVLPWIAWLLLFSYVPMYGLIIAFKEFNFKGGIWGSPWVGLDQFKMFFNDPSFWNVMINTLGISVLKLVFGFPAPIILALLINELASARYKKVVQSISYLPYFMSWVIVAGIVIRLTSTQGGGAINDALIALHIIGKPIMFLRAPNYFWGVLVVSEIWKNVGWGSIIYLAAISSIDVAMYEAAVIDGARRLQRTRFITLPSLAPTIVIMLLLQLSGILDANFDQVYMMQNVMVLERAEILDTFVYKTGLSQGRYSFATAIGLFKSLVALLLILGCDRLTKKISGHGIF